MSLAGRHSHAKDLFEVIVLLDRLTLPVIPQLLSKRVRARATPHGPCSDRLVDSLSQVRTGGDFKLDLSMLEKYLVQFLRRISDLRARKNSQNMTIYSNALQASQKSKASN
eukprot:334214-Hanusia_phi.AAC.1